MKLKGRFVLACLLSGTALGQKETLDPEAFAQEISRLEIEKHARQLNTIAQANGGNRAFGTSGYKESRDYILRMIRQCGDGIDVRLQEFTHAFNNNNVTLSGPDGRVPVLSRLVTSGEALHIRQEAPLVAVPVDVDGGDRGCGCFEDQWKDVRAKGSMALVQRGGCPIAQKMALARQHGAVGVVVYNRLPGESAATAGSDDIGKRFPPGMVGIGIGQEVGREWARRLEAGESFPVAIVIEHAEEQRASWNIIAESRSGDPDNVVMLGAHLDSVQSGPGVNDNGSGTSALVEIMSRLCRHKDLKNKVRFAWWGAEELGVVGSNYFASQLSEAEADKIRFYFNYDMIGSPSPNWTVYANTDADRYGAQHLYGVLNKSYTNVTMSEFSSNSDYVAFRKLGIPSSGIFTGAGGEMDPCYHQACDDKLNINLDATVDAARAAAYAMARLANSVDGLPARSKKTGGRR